jgi:hypothetical protein
MKCYLSIHIIHNTLQLPDIVYGVFGFFACYSRQESMTCDLTTCNTTLCTVHNTRSSGENEVNDCEGIHTDYPTVCFVETPL